MSIEVDKFQPHHLLNFWFEPPMSEHWFQSSPEIDADLNERFGKAWLAAASNAYDHWQEEAESALALVILLDQVPLNIFRNQPKSFSTEAKARTISRYAIDNDLDQKIIIQRRSFLYMPFMHSEKMADQNECIRLTENTPGLEKTAEFAHHHRSIIERFGRFPHRNAILGRTSADEEVKWLASEEGFSG